MRVNRNPYLRETTDLIEKLLKEGTSFDEIASLTDRPISSVKSHIYKNGGIKGYSSLNFHKNLLSGGAHPFSDDERNTIEKMLLDGYKCPDIGKVLGRTPLSIRCEVKRQGGVKFYKASVAIEQANRHRTPITDEKRQMILDLHSKGYSKNRIGLEVGVAPKTVERWIVRMGIPGHEKGKWSSHNRLDILEETVESIKAHNEIILEILQKLLDKK